MKPTDQQLRDIFATMDAEKAQEIREAYYQTVEGLRTLTEELQGIDELSWDFWLAVATSKLMNQSLLGKVL